MKKNYTLHHTYTCGHVYQELSSFVTTLLISLLTVGRIAVDKHGCVKYCMSNLQDKFPLQYVVHIVQYCKHILPCYMKHLHSKSESLIG